MNLQLFEIYKTEPECLMNVQFELLKDTPLKMIVRISLSELNKIDRNRVLCNLIPNPPKEKKGPQTIHPTEAYYEVHISTALRQLYPNLLFVAESGSCDHREVQKELSSYIISCKPHDVSILLALPFVYVVKDYKPFYAKEEYLKKLELLGEVKICPVIHPLYIEEFKTYLVQNKIKFEHREEDATFWIYFKKEVDLSILDLYQASGKLYLI